MNIEEKITSAARNTDSRLRGVGCNTIIGYLFICFHVVTVNELSCMNRAALLSRIQCIGSALCRLEVSTIKSIPSMNRGRAIRLNDDGDRLQTAGVYYRVIIVPVCKAAGRRVEDWRVVVGGGGGVTGATSRTARELLIVEQTRSIRCMPSAC